MRTIAFLSLFLFILAGIVAVFLGQSFWVSKYQGVLQKETLKAFETLVPYQAHFDDFQIESFFPPRIKLSHLSFSSQTSKEQLFHADSTIISVRGVSLLKGFLVVNAISFRGVHAKLSRKKSGNWNWASERVINDNSVFEQSSPFGGRLKIELNAIVLSSVDLQYQDETGILFSKALSLSAISFSRLASDQGVWEMVGDAKILEAGAGWKFQGQVVLGEGLLRIDARQDGHKVRLRGEIDDISQEPRFKLQLGLRGYPMDLIPWQPFKEANFAVFGALTGQFEVLTKGTNPARFYEELKISGVVDLREGRFKNLPLIKQVIQGAVAQTAPESVSYLEDFSRFPRDLPFKILQANLQFQDSVLWFSNLRLTDADYYIESDGKVGFESSEIHTAAKIVFLENFSQKFVQQFPELVTLRNSNARLVIPFSVRGLVPGATFRLELPDLPKPLDPKQDQNRLVRELESNGYETLLSESQKGGEII